MSPPRCFLCAVVLLLLPFLVAPQSCEALTDPVCGQFIPVGTEIFVPSGTTLEILQAKNNRIVGQLMFSQQLPDPCWSVALQYACASYLRPCYKINGTAVPIPIQPCQTGCFDLYDACLWFSVYKKLPFGIGFYFPTGTRPPLNCSDPPLDRDVGNTSFWAANETIRTYQGKNYSVPCSNPNAITPPAQLYCEEPLEVIYVQGLDHYSCAFGCPLPALSDSQYDSVKIMQGIVGWMSWVSTAFLIFTMALDPSSRKFPRNLVTMVACAANVAAGAIILPTMAGYDNTWCGGSDTYLTPTSHITGVDSLGVETSFSIEESDIAFESSLCTFQGAVLQFGFLSATFWWATIAFNMCFELYLNKVLPLEHRWWKWGRFAVYNVICWGLAFVLMVIPAAAGRIKFSSGASYCFVTSEDDRAWILPFWFIPVGIALLLGVILFTMALIRVTILLVTIKKIKELLLLYVRLFIFILLYLFLFLLIFSYNIEIEKNKDEIDSGYETYYKCLIYQQPDCSLSDSVSNYDLVMLKGWAISSLGILLFLTFLPGSLVMFWYQLFKGLCLLAIYRDREYADRLAHVLRSATTRMSSLSLSRETASLDEEMRTPREGGEDEGMANSDGELDEEEEDASSSSTAGD